MVSASVLQHWASVHSNRSPFKHRFRTLPVRTAPIRQTVSKWNKQGKYYSNNELFEWKNILEKLAPWASGHSSLHTHGKKHVKTVERSNFFTPFHVFLSFISPMFSLFVPIMCAIWWYTHLLTENPPKKNALLDTVSNVSLAKHY